MAMVTLFYQGNRLLTEQQPMLHAVEKVKFNTVLAHLWVEEIVSGDSSESVENVWQAFSRADWYCLALLYGGENEDGTFYPLKNEQMKQSAKDLRELLQILKKQAVTRYEQERRSKPGSAADKEFDQSFHALMQKADMLETSLINRFVAESDQYRYAKISLISGIVLLSLFVSHFLFRREKSRTHLVTSLNLAKYSIEEKNRELQKRAHYDVLTGLPNRMLFMDRLEQVVIHAMRTDQSVAVLFIDLDHFKSVNDNYGHHKGDLLLQTVANRVCQCIRESDTAARISGDEFMVVLSDLHNTRLAMKAANKVAEALIDSLKESYQLGDVIVDISASIGVSVYPDDSTNCDELIRYADSAMYHAKTLGKNNFQFYSRELHQQSMKQMEMERDLKDAVRYDQFILHFQPQWDLESGKVKGVEALVRWKHPSYGVIFPDEFIPTAENCGLIQRLDTLVIKKALKQQKEWQVKGKNFGVLGINISPVCFRRCNFFSDIRQIISQSGVDPALIELEITEALLVESDTCAHKLFSDLKGLGVRIALDDFGTGYSSVAYLKDFRFDTLKIDSSFVADYVGNEISTIVLKNILSLGCELGLNVVAEGVESKEQEKQLQSMGCGTGQGYLLSGPLDADSLENFMSRREENIVTFDRA